MTDALQEAINQVKREKNFGILFLPEGNYRISKTDKKETGEIHDGTISYYIFISMYVDELEKRKDVYKRQPSHLSVMPPYWVPDTRGTVLSGLITIPGNGAVRLIIMNFRGG